jgi:hypothetical protein
MPASAGQDAAGPQYGWTDCYPLTTTSKGLLLGIIGMSSTTWCVRELG